MQCSYMNCYKCFHDAYCNKLAIFNNLLPQNPTPIFFIERQSL